jgi:hypothetical protein
VATKIRKTIATDKNVLTDDSPLRMGKVTQITGRCPAIIRKAIADGKLVAQRDSNGNWITFPRHVEAYMRNHVRPIPHRPNIGAIEARDG